jgi:hypothetical protein
MLLSHAQQVLGAAGRTFKRRADEFSIKVIDALRRPGLSGVHRESVGMFEINCL